MTTMRNRLVAESWYENKEATNHRGSLCTDGQQLWSYRLLIGDTCSTTGKKVLRDYTAKGTHGFQSQTTSCHVGLAAQFADIID